MKLKSENPYKFKLFRRHPVASIISLIVIFVVCYFLHIGRIGIGQIRFSTPTRIEAKYLLFYGNINKTFFLPSGIYNIRISDTLSKGDLYYTLFCNGKEVFSTNTPCTHSVNSNECTYTLVIHAKQWTSGAFSISAEKAN